MPIEVSLAVNEQEIGLSVLAKARSRNEMVVIPTAIILVPNVPFIAITVFRRILLSVNVLICESSAGQLVGSYTKPTNSF